MTAVILTHPGVMYREIPFRASGHEKEFRSTVS